MKKRDFNRIVRQIIQIVFFCGCRPFIHLLFQEFDLSSSRFEQESPLTSMDF